MRQRAVESQAFPLKRPCKDLLALSLSARVAAQKAPGTYGERLDYLAAGRGLEG